MLDQRLCPFTDAGYDGPPFSEDRDCPICGCSPNAEEKEVMEKCVAAHRNPITNYENGEHDEFMNMPYGG